MCQDIAEVQVVQESLTDRARRDHLELVRLAKPGDAQGVIEFGVGVAGMTNPKETWTGEVGVPAQLAIVRNVIYLSSLRGKRLWRVPIEGDSERVGAKSDFYAGKYGRLRALAKVPGADELWLGSDGQTTNARIPDQIHRVTIK